MMQILRHRMQRDRRGVATLEFALVAPILFLVMFGTVKYGIVLSQYLTLTNATLMGARQFAFSAGVDAAPYTDAVSAVRTAAPNLTPLVITTAVNGTGCSTDAGCATALSGNIGKPVTVTASYSCAAMNIIFDLLPNCTLRSQQTERVQ